MTESFSERMERIHNAEKMAIARGEMLAYLAGGPRALTSRHSAYHVLAVAQMKHEGVVVEIGKTSDGRARYALGRSGSLSASAPSGVLTAEGTEPTRPSDGDTALGEEVKAHENHE